jgi:hypothetical protein
MEMTRVKAVAVRRGRWLPHLERPQPEDAQLMRTFLGMIHGRRLTERLAAAIGLLRVLRRRGRQRTSGASGEREK